MYRGCRAHYLMHRSNTVQAGSHHVMANYRSKATLVVLVLSQQNMRENKNSA